MTVFVNLLRKAAAATAGVVVLAGATTAFAVTQGTKGTTSSGSVNISASVPKLVRISNLDDAGFAFGAWSGTGDLTANDDVCVYINYTGTYQITADDGTIDAAFNITGPGGSIAYEVHWNDATGTATNVQLTENTALGSQTGASSSVTCSGGDSANVEIIIPSANLDAAASGSYSGTLNLVITPE